MGYALSAFVVPRNTILRFRGCADFDLLREVMPVAQTRLADLDEQLFNADDDDAITHEQALRELFSGNMTVEAYGATYGWAFETLCDCLGQSLSNRGFSPCRLEWYEEL